MLISVTLSVNFWFAFMGYLCISFFNAFAAGTNSLLSRIVLSDFVTDIWGKVGGIVYKKGPYGMTRILKANPVNTNTSFQAEVKNMFGTCSKAWKNLTVNQAAAWADVAKLVPFVKKGQTYYLSAKELFMLCNMNLLLIEEAMISYAPDYPNIGVQPFESFSVDVTTTPGHQDIALNISPAISSDTKLIAYATSILPKRLTNFKNKLRVIAVLDDTFTSGSTIGAEYYSRFDRVPKTGDHFGFAIRPIDIATGKPGMLMTCRATGIT